MARCWPNWTNLFPDTRRSLEQRIELQSRRSPFRRSAEACEISGMALVVRPSRIHAAGVFTTTPVRKGARIVEYDGPRITPEESDRLYDGAPRTYLYGLEDGNTGID